MKFLVPMLLFITLYISATSAGIIHSGATLVGAREPGVLVKGPSNKATVKGPSGPIIVTAGDTGAVSSGAKSGGVVSSSGQTPGVIASTIPLSPAVAPIVQVEHVAAPVYAELPDYDEPVLQYGHGEKLLY